MIKRTIIAALLGTILSTGGAMAGTIKYTYANSEYDKWGTGKKENYDVAMRINDPMLTGKKIVAVTASLYAAEGMSETSVWLTKELKLENKKNAPDIMSAAVTPNAYGELKLTLDEPYTITDEGVYVGYSANVETLDDNTKSPLLLSLAKNDNSFFIHTSRTVIKWKNYAVNLGASAVIEVTIEGDFPDNSMVVKSVPDIYCKAGGSTVVSVDVQNYGAKPVKSFDYTYTIAGKARTGHVDLTAPVEPDFVNPSPVDITLAAPAEIGMFDAEIVIDKVNGEANSTIAPINASFRTVSFVPKHRPVMEEYTGTWCGWCPRGWFALEKLNEEFGDDFIGIAYHSDDPMAIDMTDPVYVDGYPMATIDRGAAIDPYYGSSSSTEFGIKDDYINASKVFAPVDMHVWAWWSDAGKTGIDVKSISKFVLDFKDTNYRLGYVLCADGLYGTSSDWEQSNYFPKYKDDYIGTELEALCDMGDPIKELRFNEVAIVAKDVTGIVGSIPADIESGMSVEDDYVFAAADAVGSTGEYLVQNPDKLFVVAFIVDSKTKRIINAAKAPVTAEAAIDSVTAGNTAAEEVSVTYYDLQGRVTDASCQGIFIKRVTFSDGSVKTEKILH